MAAQISILSAVELGKMYENGSLSPVDVAQASLQRAEAAAALNVFVRPPDVAQVLAMPGNLKSAGAKSGHWESSTACQ